MKKVICLICCVGIFIASLSGCSAYKRAEKFVIPDNLSNDEGTALFSDDSYSFGFESETYNMFFENKETGKIWASTPYEYFETGETSYSLSSDVIINYYDSGDNSVQNQKSFECVENKAAACTVKDGSIYHKYYFSDAEISLTVKYSFNNGVLSASFNTKDIVESGKTKLISVSIAPNLCSTKNTNDKDSYLFVPAGSGALMYCDESTDGNTRTYSGEVYGKDLSVDYLDNPGNEESVRLPVFGVKSGNDALVGIITSGEGSAQIEASAGNIRTGFSSVYPTFSVRGYNNAEWNSGKNRGTELANDVLMLDKDIAKDYECTVSYYQLSGEDADYVGIANTYRNYLTDNGLLKKSKSSQKLYGVTFVGGANNKGVLLGFPHMSVVAISTFSQTENMLSKLLKTCNKTPNVVLKGYGKSGVNVGKICGGYDFSGALGGKKGQKSLMKFCVENNISVFNDFELIRFNDSGNSFSTFFDIAQSANGQSAKKYPTKINVRDNDTESPKTIFLKREQLLPAVEMLENKIGDSISGVSLSSFGSSSYSDYSNEDYKLKRNYVEQSQKITEYLKKAKHTVLYSGANAYCAGISDCINDVPLGNGSYDAFDCKVPFYEIVYKGYIPLYSSPVNLSTDLNKMMLDAVEAGVCPSFLLGSNVTTELLENNENYFYSIDFDGNLQIIKYVLNTYSEFFDDISDSAITNHRLLTDGVTETTFDNGLCVWVNHTESEASVGGIAIKANSFKCK